MEKTTIKVIREYKNHHYKTSFKKEDTIFCPNCGAKGVWVEEGPGDYYVGEEYRCVKCFYSFTFQGSGVIEDDITEQLKTGVTKIPKTPQGN